MLPYLVSFDNGCNFLLEINSITFISFSTASSDIWWWITNLFEETVISSFSFNIVIKSSKVIPIDEGSKNTIDVSTGANTFTPNLLNSLSICLATKCVCLSLGRLFSRAYCAQEAINPDYWIC